MTSGASVLAVGAFVLPIAFSANSAAADPTTTTVATIATTTSTSSIPSTSSSTSTSTTASTTSTTQVPTSTTASPAVGDEVVVVIGANGNTILADGALDAQANGGVLARTGSSPLPIWLTGLSLLVAGAFALTFKRRRHLNLYVLRASRRS